MLIRKDAVSTLKLIQFIIKLLLLKAFYADPLTSQYTYCELSHKYYQAIPQRSPSIHRL